MWGIYAFLEGYAQIITILQIKKQYYRGEGVFSIYYNVTWGEGVGGVSRDPKILLRYKWTGESYYERSRSNWKILHLAKLFQVCNFLFLGHT